MERTLPPWVDMGLLPLINVLVVFVVTGIFIAIIGENPFSALTVMLKGAFIDKGALGYTLFYATNFIFTGLAVAVAFHAMLFNIGGEGQAMMGGLGLTMAALVLDPILPPFLVVLLAIPMAALMGALWGVIPGWLQAKRGSHVLITTIMFNFIASSIIVWLLAGPLIEPGQMSPQTRSFADGVQLAQLHTVFNTIGFSLPSSPLNVSFPLALGASFGVWLLLWRTRLGYIIRASGHSKRAALYAGYSPTGTIVITMAISGALAGLMALNEVLGVQERLTLNFTAGYGFTGIAVALMGRNHPVGILLASLLFGALYQGGAELDFQFQSITREIVLIVQGFIILFSGALAHMFRPMLEKVFATAKPSHKDVSHDK